MVMCHYWDDGYRHGDGDDDDVDVSSGGGRLHRTPPRRQAGEPAAGPSVAGDRTGGHQCSGERGTRGDGLRGNEMRLHIAVSEFTISGVDQLAIKSFSV